MSQIEHVHARQILDSRGNPTVEVELALRSGATGPRRRAVAARRPASSRRPSCATAARRGGGKGVTQAVGNVNGEIAEAVAGRDATDQAGPRPRADRARRHAEQVAPRRERDPRRLARGRARGGGRGGPAAVALPRRRRGARPAGADDERPQRRRARRQQGRLPGVHGRAGRRAERSREALRMGAEVFHALKKTLHDRGLGTGGRRRGRLRARPRLQRGGAADARRGHRGRRLHARATTSRSRSTRRRASSSTDGAYVLEHEGRSLSAADELADYWAELAGALPDRLDRGRHGRGGLGRLARADRALGERVQLVGDDLFVTNTERLQRGIDERRRATRSSSRSTRSAR